MLDYLKTLFKPNNDPRQADAESAFMHQTSLAMLLMCARADHQLDELELDAVRRIAAKHFDLSVANIEALIAEANSQADASTSLYEFTSQINEHIRPEKKVELIKDMWQVAWADGRIDRYEEHLIRRVADLIYVDHARFVEAKWAAKNEAKL